MKAAKIAYWLAVLALGCHVLNRIIFFHPGALSAIDLITLGVWLFLWWKLFRRPRTWGLGIGIFLLLTIVIQIALWRVALAHPKVGYVNDSWLSFALSVLPILIGGLASISLRWLYLATSIQSPVKRHEP